MVSEDSADLGTHPKGLLHLCRVNWTHGPTGQHLEHLEYILHSPDADFENRRFDLTGLSGFQ